MTVDYPDIAPILAAKQARRQALAALSWEEKVAIIDHMRHLLPREGWRVTSVPSVSLIFKSDEKEKTNDDC